MNKQKTRAFSGSLNPIHIGHLALASCLHEYEGLDGIWSMASPQSPLKTREESRNDELCLELVKLSTNDYLRFRASDFRFRLPHPPYNVYTLGKLCEALPDRRFYFITDFDNWKCFGYRYQPECIIGEDQILIYPRPGFPIKEEELPETARLIYSPVFEIGSTFIREVLDTRRNVRYFMHPKV